MNNNGMVVEMTVCGNLRWTSQVMVTTVIRFLPAPEGEDLPWVKVFSHAFQGPGGWYIENSLTTIGKNDPIGELNRELWNSGNDADKETVRKQKRKASSFYYKHLRRKGSSLILRTRVVYSSTSLVRRSSTRSWRQCNLSSKMKLLSIPLTSKGKVLTSN